MYNNFVIGKKLGYGDIAFPIIPVIFYCVIAVCAGYYWGKKHKKSKVFEIIGGLMGILVGLTILEIISLKSSDGSSEIGFVIFLLVSFALFLLTVFVTTMSSRNYKEEIKSLVYFGNLLKKFVKNISRQIFLSKKIALKQTIMRKENIELIYREIKILSGKLIPRGNEEILEIIIALRKKAMAAMNNFLKETISYEEARISLLETLDELVTVGDILDAREKEDFLSYYSLLGIDSKADSETIKKAYRSVANVIHPDKNEGNGHLESLMTLVNLAYDTLSNTTKRKVYDKIRGF